MSDPEPTGPLPAAEPAPEAPNEGPALNLAERAAPPPAAAAAQVLAALQERLSATVKPEALAGLAAGDEWKLANQGLVAESDLLEAYVRITGLAAADEEALGQPAPYPNLRRDFLEHWLCLPVTWDEQTVVLAAATPWRLAEIALYWHSLLGKNCRFVLARRSLVERLIHSVYGDAGGAGTAAKPGAAGELDTSERALRDLALEAPIVRLVNDIFARAVELNASDIHVEPSENQLAIRFRVDGLLQTVMTPPLDTFAAIASRLKLIGGLNIAERRLPQDGRTDLHIGRAQLDIRMSTVPCMHGESIVLRLLRKDNISFALDTIGMADEMAASFTRLIQAPHGMILVVGPTGSGKTTTLYCAVSMLNSDNKKIITIEDPIEYQIKGVTQIQVRPTIGLTFAGGLRHIVRQDPDIILVGEIRDRETADIAIHAALTGHLVLSTLHTNDACGALSRLIDMHVEHFLLSSALIGVLSQRLVRRLCPTCGGSGRGTGRHCRTCNGSGFSGRIGIFEFLVMNDELRDALRKGADNATMNTIARRHGMHSLREDGDEKVTKQVTSAAEVARACQLDFI